MVEREADDLERLTLAVAAGSAIAAGGPQTYEAWQRAKVGSDNKTSQRHAIARLAAMFPGAVKEN